MECGYCGETNYVLCETKYWKTVVSPHQGYLGRCVVFSKRHVGTLAELTQEEWIDFSENVRKLEFALKKSFDATMFNWTCMMNNSYLRNPPSPHVHWHFRPRYDKKVKFAGLTFEDPDFGKHYDRTRDIEVSQDVVEKIVERIKENL